MFTAKAYKALQPVKTAGEYFDYIVVGGGIAGSLVAGRLLTERHRVLLIERGPNVLRAPEWHHAMPAASLAHGVIGSPYFHREPTKRSIQAHHEAVFDVPLQLPEGAAAAPSTSELVTPSVLGGAGVVMGNRTWFRGTQPDWCDAPWNQDRVLHLMRKLERVPGAGVWRGTHGKMSFTRPTAHSPLYRPILDMVTRRGPQLMSRWNEFPFPNSVGCGRVDDVLADLTGHSVSTLRQYLGSTVMVADPVVQGTARGLHFGKPNAKGEAPATHVEYVPAGATESVVAEGAHIVMCAGAIGTPQILLNSELPQTAPVADIGTNLWSSPSATLQYACNEPVSLAPASDPIVRLLALAEWRYRKAGWGASAYDDMALYLAPRDLHQMDPYPTVRVTVQPFHLHRGKMGSNHGFQFVVQLIRPEARGAVSKAGVDTGALAHEEDVAELRAAVDLLREAMADPIARRFTDGVPTLMALDEAGPYGGTCAIGTCVSPESLLLRGTSNVYVCDGSVHTRGRTTDAHLMTMLGAEQFCDVNVRRMMRG